MLCGNSLLIRLNCTFLWLEKNMSLLKTAGLVGWKMSTRLVKYIRLSAGRFTDIWLKISAKTAAKCIEQWSLAWRPSSLHRILRRKEKECILILSDTEQMMLLRKYLSLRTRSTVKTE